MLARARALRVKYREGLCFHTPDETGVRAELGASAVIAVDGDSWEAVDFPADERHLQGYRYASTDDDAGTMTHLVGGQPTESHPLRPGPR